MNLGQTYKECARFGLAGEKEDWLSSVRRGIINPDAMLQHILMTKEEKWNKEELEYNHLFRSQRIKLSAKMIFYPDEIDELYIEFQSGYDYNGNIANLGLIINT